MQDGITTAGDNMSRGKMERTLDVLATLNNSPLERNFRSAIAQRIHLNDRDLKRILTHLISRGYVATHFPTPKNNVNHKTSESRWHVMCYTLTPVGQKTLMWINMLELTS